MGMTRMVREINDGYVNQTERSNLTVLVNCLIFAFEGKSVHSGLPSFSCLAYRFNRSFRVGGTEPLCLSSLKMGLDSVPPQIRNVQSLTPALLKRIRDIGKTTGSGETVDAISPNVVVRRCVANKVNEGVGRTHSVHNVQVRILPASLFNASGSYGIA